MRRTKRRMKKYEEEGSTTDERKKSAEELSDGAVSRRSSVCWRRAKPQYLRGTPYGSDSSSTMKEASEETFGGHSPITEPGVRKKRIKLVVDREYETSSTGEDSAPEPQRNRLSNVNSHSNINGNVYLSQNGTIVRTRRPVHTNNLKVSSPGRLGKPFKKLDMLTETQEKLPLNSMGEPVTGNGICTLMGITSTVDINLNNRSSSGSLGSSIIRLDIIGFKYNIAKALHDRNSRSNCCVNEQESCVDNMASKETLTSHSDHTLSEEEELWMGPWNSLHIPMTKL
ncbi:unnamed protein product [Coregonus sp. 'balchen']|nr:unnamed protein product [Coregonus sp. 'balchen']